MEQNDEVELNSTDKSESESDIELDSTQEIARLNLPERTNSISIEPIKKEEGEEDDFVEHKIKPSDRSRVGNNPFDLAKAQDMLKVAVVSHEASKTFTTNFQRKAAKKNAFQNPSKIPPEPVKMLTEVNNKPKKTGNYNEFLQNVFQDKPTPHVMAVTEGEREVFPQSVSLKDIDEIPYQYNLREFYIQGKNSQDRPDSKQNIHFYVREDMEDAIKIEKAEIPVPNMEKESFSVGKISFSTTNSETLQTNKYSILTVHIPQENAKQQEDTHKAIENYAQKQQENGETVMAYMGDTNYKEAMDKSSVPSYGGVYKGEEGNQFISHISSSDKKNNTIFMQTVSLDTNKKNTSFAVLQPSTPHISNPGFKGSKLGVDHPSMQNNFLVDGEIVGRKYNKKPEESSRENLKEELMKKGKEETEKQQEKEEKKISISFSDVHSLNLSKPVGKRFNEENEEPRDTKKLKTLPEKLQQNNEEDSINRSNPGVKRPMPRTSSSSNEDETQPPIKIQKISNTTPPPRDPISENRPRMGFGK